MYLALRFLELYRHREDSHRCTKRAPAACIWCHSCEHGVCRSAGWRDQTILNSTSSAAVILPLVQAIVPEELQQYFQNNLALGPLLDEAISLLPALLSIYPNTNRL